MIGNDTISCSFFCTLQAMVRGEVVSHFHNLFFGEQNGELLSSTGMQGKAEIEIIFTPHSTPWSTKRYNSLTAR